MKDVFKLEKTHKKLRKQMERKYLGTILSLIVKYYSLVLFEEQEVRVS